MKTILISICLSAFLGALSAFTADPPKPSTGSAEFEKLKRLAGTWKGSTDMGSGPMTVMVQYRVIADGSALEERLFADTPKEKDHHPFTFESVKS